jgi:DtxR family transcriptional regulator, Mn-dependent transcriptional regulator
MSFISLAFSSNGMRPLSALVEGESGVVAGIRREGADDSHAERLFTLGVTPGAAVRVLQTFPGVVFLCDQTELVVERSIAHAILIRSAEALP